MFDLLLNSDGDLKIDSTGDIALTESVRQAIRVRLRWLAEEWRFNREVGIPYFTEILVKNPNEQRIMQLFRIAILGVDEVKSVKNMRMKLDRDRRKMNLTFTVITDKETFDQEVAIDV